MDAVVLLLAGAASGRRPACHGGPRAGPWSVELFTSQGCSSCPPAPMPTWASWRADPDVVALSFHVDYWDHIGWKDLSPRASSRNASVPMLACCASATSTHRRWWYLAIERMLGHESGMIGFPLRLLARENYDRIVEVKGVHKVALITGEEKIVPPGARYFVCTVKSMPLDRSVSFLAVDEVQMAADPERGHFFTDRILYARGMNETMLLVPVTIRPVLNRLLPDIDVVARPRFSKLSYVGPKKATRLRPAAVVGFSAADVYAIAEVVRRQRAARRSSWAR